MPGSVEGPRDRGPRALWVVASLWGVSVGLALAWLSVYGSREGDAGRTVSTWPLGGSLRRASPEFDLLVFLHPRCPCSPATLAELGRILPMVRERGSLAVRVVLVGTSSGSGTAPMTRAALGPLEAIPSVRVVRDPDGIWAREFGATTSGCVLLYDAHERLRFRGGITPSRGHQGDSAGRAAVLAVLAGDEPARRETPIFGCPLVREPSTGAADPRGDG